MPTLKELQDALIQADAAGNFDDAQMIADAIREQQTAQAKPSSPDDLPAADFMTGISNAASNLPGSVAENSMNTLSALFSPTKTGMALGDLITGGTLHGYDYLTGAAPMTEEQMANPEGNAQRTKAIASGAWQGAKDRYGSPKRAWKSFQDDPAGVVTDVASFVPVASVGKLGALGKIVKAGDLSGKVVKMATKPFGILSELAEKKGLSLMAKPYSDAVLETTKKAGYDKAFSNKRTMSPRERDVLGDNLDMDIRNYNPKLIPKAAKVADEIKAEFSSNRANNLRIGTERLEGARQDVNARMRKMGKGPNNDAEKAASLRIKKTLDKAMDTIGTDRAALTEARDMVGRQKRVGNIKDIRKEAEGFLTSEDSGIRSKAGALLRDSKLNTNPVERDYTKTIVQRTQNPGILESILETTPWVGGAAKAVRQSISNALVKGDLGALEDLTRIGKKGQRKFIKGRNAFRKAGDTYVLTGTQMRDRREKE